MIVTKVHGNDGGLRLTAVSSAQTHGGPSDEDEEEEEEEERDAVVRG